MWEHICSAVLTPAQWTGTLETMSRDEAFPPSPVFVTEMQQPLTHLCGGQDVSSKTCMMKDGALSAEIILSSTQGLLREGSAIRSTTGPQSGQRQEFWVLNCEEIMKDQGAGGVSS